MPNKFRERLFLAFFAALLLGGLLAPLATPNYGLINYNESLYMPVPYL
jgi:hypothetical protein